MAVYGKVDHGRPRQSQVQPGTAGYSQVTWGPHGDHLGTTWASSGAYLAIIWGISGASGQSKISAVLHASLMRFS